MARKSTITKEIILQAALELLVKEGSSGIHIKALAKKIGCSTQPIVWHFKNMEDLRQALVKYTLSYAQDRMAKRIEGLSWLEQIESSLLELSIQKPNVFRFLFLEKNYGSPEKNFETLMLNEQLVDSIALEFGFSQKSATKYLMDCLIYTFGIASMVTTKILTISKEEAMYLIKDASHAFLQQLS